MIEDDKYMDDQFKKASEDLKFPYQSSFWNVVEAQLADDSLDYAFKSASEKVMFVPQMDFTESLDDAFLDESFKSAADTPIDYKTSYWEQFQANLPLIQQDEAFLHASNSTTTPYQPHYWSDADVALQNEGLHYEYKAAYWNEAKVLLDKSDRGIFFLKWSAVAAILLLLSFGGIYNATNNEQILSEGNSIPSNKSNLSINTNQNESNLIFALQENFTAEILVSDLNSNNIISDGNSTAENNLSETNLTNRYTNQNSNINNTTSQLIMPTNTIDVGAVNDVPVLSMNDEPMLSSQFDSGINDTEILNADELIIKNDVVSFSEGNPIINSQSETNILTNQTENNNVDLGLFNKLNVGDVSKIENETNPTYLRPQIKIEKFKLNPTHNLSFIGHIGLGNKYGTTELTPSWRTTFGFEYMRTSFGRMRNFEFGASLMINHVRQNDFGTERRVNVFQNDGGVEKFWYKLQIKDMMYANINAICNYRINQHHKIKLSVGVDYLVFVQSNMSYQTKADQGITTVNNNWGVKDGLNKLDLRVGVGYEWQMCNRIALQANASYGFFDRTDNAFLQKTISDHEMNVTLGIKYTLFRKI